MSQLTDKRILLIDDEPLVTKTIALYLTRAGFGNVQSVNAPAQALEVIRNYRPHVVLLDISMPEIDGLKILEQLSGQVIEDEITVIMVTSAEEDHIRRRALILGACDFISKPVREDELVSRVSSALMGRPNMNFILQSLPPKATANSGTEAIDTTPPAG